MGRRMPFAAITARTSSRMCSISASAEGVRAICPERRPVTALTGLIATLSTNFIQT